MIIYFFVLVYGILIRISFIRIIKKIRKMPSQQNPAPQTKRYIFYYNKAMCEECTTTAGVFLKSFKEGREVFQKLINY